MMVYFLITVGDALPGSLGSALPLPHLFAQAADAGLGGLVAEHVPEGQPRMEYICVYGHGTLKMPEVELTGPKSPDWQPQEDMWKELEALGEKR